jgi:hypothetical protein
MRGHRASLLLPLTASLCVVASGLTACGGEGGGEDATTAEAGCTATYSLPVAAAELEPDGRTVRIAYAGPEPCQFAATTYNGDLFIELRTATEGEPTIDPSDLAGCVQGELEKPLPSGTRVFPVNSGGGEAGGELEQQGQHLLDSTDCGDVERGTPAFTIN